MTDLQGRTRAGEAFGADRRRLVRLAYRFVWNQADAEDAVQNALAIAHTRRDELRDAERWYSWLCRIVVRQCLSLRRSEGRRTRRESLLADTERKRQSGAASESLHNGELVRWAIDQLPPRQRAAVTLRHLEEMPYERIAEVLEISPSTARVHVRDGREAMRVLIERRDPEFGEAASPRK